MQEATPASTRASAARPPPSSLSLLSSPLNVSKSPAEAVSSGSAAAPAAKKGRKEAATKSPAAAPPVRRSLSAGFAAAVSARDGSTDSSKADSGPTAHHGSKQSERH